MRRAQITDAMREAMADVGDPLPDLADLASRNRIPPEHRDSRPRHSAWGPGSVEANERRMFSGNPYDPDFVVKGSLFSTMTERREPEPVRFEKCSCGRVLQRGLECDCRPSFGPAAPNVVERSVKVGGWRVPVLQPDLWVDPAEEVKPSLRSAIARNTDVGSGPLTPQTIADVVERTRAQLGHPTPANRAGRRSRPGPIDI